MGIPFFVNSCAKFSRKCFAIIHRTNDNDDKLIVMSDGQKCIKYRLISPYTITESHRKRPIVFYVDFI